MISLKVNGTARNFDGDPNLPLLWYLRDVLELTGTKFGCGVALCGACTVHRNGESIRSCIIPMHAVAGTEIVTIEGISNGSLHPVQKAWVEHNVPQCGYCQSGQIMQAVVLLNKNHNPTDKDIDDAMAGNICRCGTYQRIRAAIKAAAEEQRMTTVSNLSRRGFLKGAFADRRVCPGCALHARIHREDGRPKDITSVDRATLHPNVWVGVNPDGTVYIIAHRSEMGTAIRTSLPLVVADEMDADWKQVRLEQAIGDERYGDQDTDGSHSIRNFYAVMRQAGATARVMLVQAAAQQWSVAPSECQTDLHTVVHSASGRKLGYGELAATAAKLPLPKEQTSSSSRRIAGATSAKAW